MANKKRDLPRGVDYTHNKQWFRAGIKLTNKTLKNASIYLGTYNNKDLASKAYQIACKIVTSKKNPSKLSIINAVNKLRKRHKMKRLVIREAVQEVQPKHIIYKW